MEAVRGGDEAIRGADDENANIEGWLDPSLRSLPETPCNEGSSPSPQATAPRAQGGHGAVVQTDTNNSRSQRARRAAALKVPVTLGDKHSEWLGSSYKYLLDDKCGTIWSETIEAWLQFEKDLPLANLSSSRLPAIKSRPTELTHWLGKRDFASPPLIPDVSAYAESMKRWWTNMKTHTSRTQSSGTLQHLRNGGPNGIVTLLFGLRWWWLNVGQDAAQWDVVMQEIHGMFQEFAGNFANNATKRKSDMQSSKNKKRQKKGN
ncbi:hypothetical protein JOM56_008028 [Amanita muscaria]